MPSLPMPSFDNGARTDYNGGIKMEADAQGGMSGVSPVPAPNVPPFQGLPGGGSGAAARAAQQLHQTFGQRAAASINAIHSGMSQQPQPQQQQQQQQQRPGGNVANQQQYRQNGGANNLGNAQNDGVNDDDDVESQYEGVLLQKQKAGQPPVELGRVEIDRMMHEQIAANAKQMEGGGLMMPMMLLPSGRSGPSSSSSHKRKATAGISAAAAAHLGLDEAQVKAMGKAIAQVDGAGDDDDAEVEDEDAINSDLDDPDDNRDEDEDDEDAMSPIMLCVYDKVQRVKNKWYAFA